MFGDAALVEALEALGGLLESRGEEHDLVLIGGGALLLLGAIDRPTKDLGGFREMLVQALAALGVEAADV